LQPAPFALVAHDLDEPNQRSGFIAHRAEDAGGPKASLVLTYMPTLVFRPPDCGGRVDFSFGYVRSAIFRSEKDERTLSDDFVLGVAENAFGAAIPVDYLAAGVGDAVWREKSVRLRVLVSLRFRRLRAATEGCPYKNAR
jgi:hypothetical protein